MITGLIAGSLVLLVAAGPATGERRIFQSWVTLQNSARISESLEVERSQGKLVLPPDIASPSHRVWHLGEDQGLTVEGRVERGKLLIERVRAEYVPAREGARGGTVTVVAEPVPGADESCASGPWIPATVEVTYDGADGPVAFSAAGRYAITGQFDTSAQVPCQLSGASLQDFNFVMTNDKA